MSAGKGDKPRPVDGEKFRNNYDKIFRKKLGFYACQAPIGTFEEVGTFKSEDSNGDEMLILVSKDEYGNTNMLNLSCLDKIKLD
jgi:hypothetical protein